MSIWKLEDRPLCLDQRREIDGTNAGLCFRKANRQNKLQEAAVGGGDQETEICCSEVFRVAGCPQVTWMGVSLLWRCLMDGMQRSALL